MGIGEWYLYYGDLCYNAPLINKGVKMPVSKTLDPILNGFIVVKDLGRYKSKTRYAIVICKACSKEFETSVYVINKIKSCGCLPDKKMKALPDYINGFKTVRDFGYDLETRCRRALVICKVCQKEYEVDPNKLKYRKHCGCLVRNAVASKYTKTHKQATAAMHHMKRRCYDKNDSDYYNYGARGITICEEWLNDINVFVEWSLRNGYENNKKLSIDRIDSSKGYYPENCRWVTAKIQARNTRRNVMTQENANKIRGEYSKMTQQELAKKYKVSKGTISNIILNKSWTE